MVDSEQIAEWIPLGYDVYAIGVQECLNLHELRDKLQTHLGGSDCYTMFTQEIGSTQTTLGYHGFIALTVFAKTDDVSSGAFSSSRHVDSTVSQGQNLGIVKAQNKGAVGLGFYYYDTSFAFITAHFAADTSGKHKFLQRNDNALSAVEKSCLVGADVGASVNFQHHHVFVMGDLNYRMNGESTIGLGTSLPRALTKHIYLRVGFVVLKLHSRPMYQVTQTLFSEL